MCRTVHTRHTVVHLPAPPLGVLDAKAVIIFRGR